MKTALEIRLLGGLDIKPAAPGAATLGKKARGLMAYLAVRGEDGQSRDGLAGIFWCDSPNPQARTNLRQTLSTIRRFLGPNADRVLRAEKEHVALNGEAIVLDLPAFEVAAGSDDGAELERAAELYRGDFLDGFDLGHEVFEQWARVERERLRRLASGCLTRLLDSHLASGDAGRIVETASKLLALEPVHEAAHRALMRTYALQQRPAEALKQYESCRIALQKELGVQPQPETTDLFQEIRRQRSGTRAGATEEVSPDDAWTPRAEGGAPLPPGPSICVLPFRTLRGAAEDDYLAVGISENIVVSLTRFSELCVIAHGSAMRGSAEMPDTADLATRLGVRYLLSGSVAKIGDRLRVTVTLAEADTGQSLWAERYDRPFGDIFDLQEEISDSVVSTLFVRVVEADRQRLGRKRDEDLGAYDLVLRARHLLKTPSEESRLEAKACLERAIEIDGENAAAHGWLACYHVMRLFHPHAGDHDRLVAEAYRWARRAVDLDRSDYFGRIMLALTCYLKRDFAGAHRHARASYDQNPNDYEVLCCKGWIDAVCGNIGEGIAIANRALRLNPLAPGRLLHDLGARRIRPGELRGGVGGLRRHAVVARLASCRNRRLPRHARQAERGRRGRARLHGGGRGVVRGRGRRALAEAPDLLARAVHLRGIRAWRAVLRRYAPRGDTGLDWLCSAGLGERRRVQSEIQVATARPEDEAAVTALLQASYPLLMRQSYAEAAMAAAMPLMARANPKLLASGRFYLVRGPDGAAVGCGGWSLERPGEGGIEPELAHIRHFATHPDFLGRGIGRAIYRDCRRRALAAGARRFECYSSLNAEAFYAALGFETVEPMTVDMGPDVSLPAIRMVASI